MSIDISGFGAMETAYILRALREASAASSCAIRSLRGSDPEARCEGIRAKSRDFTAFAIHADYGVYIVPVGRSSGCLKCFLRWIGRKDARSQSKAVQIIPQFALDAMVHIVLEYLEMSSIRELVRPFTYIKYRPFTIQKSEVQHAEADCEACSRARISQPTSLYCELRNWENHPASSRAYQVESVGADVLPVLVDGTWGLISRVERSVSPGALQSIAVAHLGARHFGASGERTFGRTGDVTKDLAISALEAVERFAALRPRSSCPITTSSYAALGSIAVDPHEFILPERGQVGEDGFQHSSYSPTVEYDWVEAFSLKSMSVRLVPAQLGYFGYRSANPADGGMFALETSSGCATGGNLLEAICYGLFEVVERDAFLTHWYGGSIARKLSIRRPADPAIRGLLSRLGADDLHLEVYDISTLTNLTSIAARITDPFSNYGPGVIFASGAHLDADTALRSALSEAVTFLQMYPETGREDRRRRGDELLERPELVQTVNDHLDQAWGANASSRLDFLVTEDPTDIEEFLEKRGQHSAGSRRLSDVISAVLEIAHDVLIVEQSAAPYSFPTVRSVKVLVPGLHPLTFGHQYRRISQKRLRQSSLAAYVDGPFCAGIRPHAFS